MKAPPPPLPHNASKIPQFDGNYSILTTSSDESSNSSVTNLSIENSWFSQPSESATAQPNLVSQSNSSFNIPVITGFRPHRQIPVRLPPARKVLRRENRCLQALSLPNILSYNMRSIWGKLKCLAEDVEERAGEVIFLCEVWEKSENKEHRKKLEELFEMRNIQYISTPRPGVKRGGGAAIATHSDKFSVSKLNITIPKPLEIVWALLRPLQNTGLVKKIILCSFYSPPNSRKNLKLIDHISITYHSLKIQHPEAAIIISGDKNNLDERKLLALNPDFRQIVTQNTRQNKTLTIIISDLHRYYQTPVIIPPVPVDIPGQGVPSDHNGVLALPITAAHSQRSSQSRKVKVRPLPTSLIHKFGNLIVNQDWSFIEEGLGPTEMVDLFQNYTDKIVKSTFPEKMVTISDHDKPYFTEELRLLRRQRQRAYRKGGRNAKYMNLKAKFDQKLKSEAQKYTQKIIAEVAEGKRGSSYPALKKLEFGKNTEKSANFTLPGHSDENLTALQSAEKFADYFSEISQEFDPISVEKLPPWIRDELIFGKSDTAKPILSEYEVYKKLRKIKKPNSVVPGDIPVKLVKEFTPELAAPMTKIFNRITQTAEYPRQWVTEHQIVIPKVKPPLSEDDTRNIASTSFFSKLYESFIGDWIFPYIEPYIDPGQCGGLRGSSITHYLVKLLHFVHSYLDLKQPHAVLLVLVDLEKAFNRVSHQQVIEDLADMHVPGWLLLLLISYLTGRSMYMRYKGATSSRKWLPGSSPQGAFLGILLFIILFNGALLRPAIPRLHSLNLNPIQGGGKNAFGHLLC